MATIKNINIDFGDEHYVADIKMSDGVSVRCIGVFTDEALAGGKAITVTEATPRNDAVEALCERLCIGILGSMVSITTEDDHHGQ